MGTGWIRGELPPGGAAGVEQLDLAPYVKDVSVEDGHEAAGEPAVKVTGVLDTSGLVKGVLGQLGTVDGTALPDAADVLGDTRVVLYVSEASDLTRRLLVDTTMEAAGEEAALHMDLALTPAKRSVRIPRVG